MRVTGHPAGLAAEDLPGVVVHTDMERTGWFACSDDRVNRLHEAALWSFRGNACDVPTDCPTRERGAWTGDWQIFVSARHPARAQRRPDPAPGEDLSDFEAFKRADKADVATAFLAHPAGVMSRIATLLGRVADAVGYRELAQGARW